MSNVIEWVEKAANLYGDKKAFVYHNDSISFKELRDVSRMIGKELSRILQDNTPVAVIMPKSIETVCSYFGVVYSGRCYAPIDSSMPEKRIRQVLSTLKPSIVITTSELLELVQTSVDGLDTKIVLYDEIATKGIVLDYYDYPKIIGTDPLYIIFTSGSTGQPKGVVASHLSLMTYIRSYSKMMDMTEEDIIGNQSPLDYIAAIRDIYIPVFCGCTTVIFDKKLFMQPDVLFKNMDVYEVTCVGWSASSLKTLLMLHAFENGVVPRKIRKICFSGSSLDVATLTRWQEALPYVRFINQYGPTEVTASCTYYVIDDTVNSKNMIPIGVPYEDYRVFVLDERGEEAASDSIGEICVAGQGIALGYYNNPDETKKRFVQNPINKLYSETIYRTGDLGSKDKNGVLWFHGRMDRQIKIMGHRVELDAVEETCCSVVGVTEAACVYDDEREQLRLYYVGNVDKSDLLKQLRIELPSFMIPRIVSCISEMPKLPNGKTDYNNLLGGTK